MKSYEIDPHAYLLRAKSLIEQHEADCLFYAAFELRCFVEQRQGQYAEAQQSYLKSIPQSWKLTKQFKNLQRTYDREQIQALTWEISGVSSLQMHFVPVSKSLLDATVRIDSLRHAQQRYYPPDDAWWSETRQKIVDLYRLCWICSQGNMLAPALIDKNRFVGEVAVRVAMKDDDVQGRLLSNGAKGTMKVEYLDTHPSSWICDLES